jgi:hypothetical protein
MLPRESSSRETVCGKVAGVARRGKEDRGIAHTGRVSLPIGCAAAADCCLSHVCVHGHGPGPGDGAEDRQLAQGPVWCANRVLVAVVPL